MIVAEHRTGNARSVFGIDASRALSDAPTGTEYYSRALIDALLMHNSPFFFRLYSRAAPPPDFFPSTGNYEQRVIPFPRLWTHLRLGIEMLTHPPASLFVPAHVLPPFHPHNSLVTVHDLGYKFFPAAHPYFQRLYLDLSTRWNVRRARAVIADSFATRDDICRVYGAPANKIHVVYPGYNHKVFRPTRDPAEIESVRAKYSLTTPYLISVGTVHPRKNYKRLVQAAAALAPEYSLVLVGKAGWLSEPLMARVRAAGMESRVRLLEYVPLQDLPALYAGAQLAVFPSLYEGFGFPALEAQACETPLACSSASSLPEVAGEGALYFDPLRVEEMARAIEMILKDETVRQELIARGRSNLKRYSWERAAGEIIRLAQG